MKKRAVVILADGFEETEAVASIDILRRADIETVVCGLRDKTVNGAHDIKMIADTTLEELKGPIDALVLPGGMPGAENLAKSKKVADMIRDAHKRGALVAAICASPALVLAPTGILKGKKATCYPGMEGDLGKGVFFTEERVVVDGNIITSRGPGTALAFALAIVEKLAGVESAKTHKERTLA
ncbi:MAG: DJ-1 family glyoxalase III [Candidatus Omnitrophota bacterium]